MIHFETWWTCGGGSRALQVATSKKITEVTCLRCLDMRVSELDDHITDDTAERKSVIDQRESLRAAERA